MGVENLFLKDLGGVTIAVLNFPLSVLGQNH